MNISQILIWNRLLPSNIYLAQLSLKVDIILEKLVPHTVQFGANPFRECKSPSRENTTTHTLHIQTDLYN